MRILAFILPVILLLSSCNGSSESSEKSETARTKPEKPKEVLSYSIGILASGSIMMKLEQSQILSIIIPEKIVKGINDFHSGKNQEMEPMQARENLSQFFRKLQETGQIPQLTDRDIEILSYCIGMDAIREVTEQFTNMKLQDEVDINFVVQAMNHYILKEDIFIGEEEAKNNVEKYFTDKRKVDSEKELVKYQENKIAGEKYLEENKKKPGIKVTQSGLQIETIREGKGAQPKLGDTVEVHYKGTHINGEQFDSSYDRKETYTFLVDYNYPIILGWIEAVQQMKKGGKYRIVLPSDLAYKDRLDMPIKPYSVLIFEIELISINEVKMPQQ